MELPNNANRTASAENNKSEWVQDREIVNAQDPELAAPLIVDNRGAVERAPASEPTDEDYSQALADIASDPNPVTPSVTEVDEPTEADFRAALTQQERDFGERPPATFDDVSSMISDYDAEKAKQVSELAAKLKTTPSNVLGLLQKHTFEELKNLKGLGDVTLAYPGLYNWAQDPKNYKSLIRDPERQKRIADNTEYLKKAWDETSRLGKANWAQMYQVSLMAMMSTGKMDVNEGTRKLRELDLMIRDNQTVAYKDAVQKFGKSFENLQKDFEKTGNIWGTISEENVLTPEGKLRALGKYYKGLTGSMEGVGEVLSEVIDNPAGFLVGVAGQSAYSFVPSILAGKTATVAGTLIAGPQTGIVAGLSAGVATQAFISYGQSFQQAADKFRDKKTGLVNYEKMFKDPEVLNDLRIKGAKYAGAHALFEFVAGKFIKTNISSAKADMAIAKITGKGSQAAIAAKATGKAVVADVAKEALGETTAQVAQGESVSKAASEGFVEGLAGSVFGIGNVAFEWSTAPAIPVQEASTMDLVKGSAKEIANIRNRPAAVMEKVKTYRHAMKAKAKAETAEGQAISVKDVKEQLKNSDLAASKAQAQEMLNDLNQFEGDEGLNQTSVATINLVDLEGFSENIGIPLINIVESLGDIAQRNYYEAVNNNLSDFTVPLGDFEVGSIDYDGLEDIAYFNDGEVNATEGKEINEQAPEALKAMEKDLDDTITFLQEDGEDGELPPIPEDLTLADILGEEAPAMDNGEMETDMTGEDVQIVSRPVEVLYRGKKREQMEAFQKLLKALRNTVAKVEGMSPEMADVLAELQYNNLRYRSEVTGVPIMELAKTMTVSSKVKDKKARGETTFTLDDLGSIKKFRVALSAKAGIDTAIHEFAHVWIASMGEDVKIVNSISPDKRSEAQNNFIEVAQIAAEKLGLNSLAELSSLKEGDQRRIQEVFAQTAESYFLKGEQPKGKMALVMNMMRKWMANMARAVSMRLRFSSYPTLAIDAKVQRIFETILRNETVAEREVDDIFEGAIFDERILGARSAEYKELLNSIREEAIAKVYAKASNASFEEREKLIDAQLDSIYENARDEVSQSSVILFRDSIVNGDPDLRITHESIVQELAGGDADVAADLISRMPRKMVAGKKKAGMDVRFYMAQLGISDPAEMTTFLLAGANEAALVDKAAQEMIDLFFPPMKTDKEIHEEAVQAVNGTLRERKVRLELSILADKSPRKLMQLASIVAQPGANANKEMMLDESMEGLQSKAVRFVNAQQVKTFRPNVILGMANRYGRKAAKYLAKGDFDAAFEMKEQEAMYVLAYKESLAKKKLIDQTVKRFKKYSGMGDRLAVQKGLAPELIAYINAIGNNMSGINGNFPKIFVEELRLSKTIDASFEEKVNTRVDVLNTAMRSGNNADITVENFIIVGEIVKASASQARQSLAQHKVLMNNTITDAANTMAVEIGTYKTGDSKAEIGKRGSKTFPDVVAGLTADLQSVTNYFVGLFPSEAEFGNSMVGKMLAMVRNVEAIAQQKRDADWSLLSSKVKAIAMKDPTNRGLWKAIRSRIPVFRTQALGKPIPAPMLNHTFSNKGEIIRLIALMGSDSGRQAVIEGGITQDDNNIVSLGSFNPDTQEFESPLLDAFIQESFNNGTITKEDMDLVQAMWDVNEKHYATVKEAVYKQFHFPIGYVKPKKISTPWGEYSGGYVPLHRAISTQKSNELLNKFTPDGMLTNTSDLFPFFTPAMAKERSGKVLPVSLDLSRLRADMNAIYRVGYMMNSMYAVAKVFAEPSFRESIESRRPGLMDNVLIPWVHRTLGQQYSSDIESNTFKEIAKFIQLLRRNQSISAFIFSPYTIAKQQLGVFPAASIVGQTRIYRSWLNVTLRRKAIMADISKRSNVMERRFANNTSRDIDSFEDFDMNFDKLSTMREFTEKLTYLPIQFSQNLVDAATFLAAEDFAKTKLKLEATAASKYAETVVERTQGSTAVSARPAVMYAGGEFGRLVTTFGSQVLAIYGLNRSMGERLAVTMADKKALRLASLGYIIGMTTLIPAIGGFMISTTPKLVAMGVDDEDEDKGSDYVNDMAVEVLKEMLDVAVPFIGNPLVTLALEGRQQATGLIPMVRTVEAIARTGGRAAEGTVRAAREIQDFGDTDISLTRNELRDTLTAISAIVGDPLSSTIRRALGEYSKVEDLIEE